LAIARGGAGQRLFPLTRDRTKPAAPVNGRGRIINITLANCIDKQLRNVS
jgi:glucose-1-phosphate adenylyltransferase